jgi:hypothetical protein
MALDQTPSVPSAGRSTWRVLGTLLFVFAVGLAGLAACVRAYIGSTPSPTLEVQRSELAVLVPKFYPLPSMGSDTNGQTHGVWVTLDDDGAAVALSSLAPQQLCVVAWRAQMRVEGVTGVYRDACGGPAYNRDGSAIVGATPRGLDGYDVRVDGSRIIVDLSQVRLGICREPTATECSRPEAPVYRIKPFRRE